MVEHDRFLKKHNNTTLPCQGARTATNRNNVTAAVAVIVTCIVAPAAGTTVAAAFSQCATGPSPCVDTVRCDGKQFARASHVSGAATRGAKIVRDVRRAKMMIWAKAGEKRTRIRK